MANQIIKGENVMLFVDGHSIAFATSHSLSVNIGMVECSHKDANNGGAFYDGTPGLCEWEVSSENLIGDPSNGYSYPQILALALKREPIDVVMAPKSEGSTEKPVTNVPEDGWTAKDKAGFKGKAIITSVSANYPNAENSTMSITMKGIGELESLYPESDTKFTPKSETATQTASTTKVSAPSTVKI